MEVLELAPGEPLPRHRNRAPSEDDDEEERGPAENIPQQLREEPGVLELENPEERAERQTLTTRVLRYASAFPAECESFKLSRKKLDRLHPGALRTLEADVSHAVATRRTASAMKGLFLAGVHLLEVGLPYAGLEVAGLTGAVSRDADLLATVDEVAIKRDLAVAVAPEIRLLAGLGRLVLAVDQHNRSLRPAVPPAPPPAAPCRPDSSGFDDL
jgi:hypothetical protein